jgi:hypothetical protein
MDHSEAVRLQAAEKYVLGELQGAARDEYEEHYFGCVECGADLKATAAFAAMSRVAFREDAVAAPVRDRSLQAAPAPSWFERFRWALVGVPALASLLLIAVVGYQSTVTIPKLKSEASLAAANTYNQPLELGASAMRRGAESANATPYLIDPRQGFSLTFDFTPPTPYQAAYVCQLKDPSGRVLLQVPISNDKILQTATLSIPGRLVTTPGKYEIAFLGADPASGLPTQTSSASSFAITIAFRQ